MHRCIDAYVHICVQLYTCTIYAYTHIIYTNIYRYTFAHIYIYTHMYIYIFIYIQYIISINLPLQWQWSIYYVMFVCTLVDVFLTSVFTGRASSALPESMSFFRDVSIISADNIRSARSKVSPLLKVKYHPLVAFCEVTTWHLPPKYYFRWRIKI